MNYRNIDDLNHCILQHLSILPRDFDLIVGIPRSGMFPANLLALYLNLPVTDLDSFRNGHIYQTGERGKTFNMTHIRKVLVVDDSIATGNAINKCRTLLKALNDNYEIKYCAIYSVPEHTRSVDYHFEILDYPRFFQWNIMNHAITESDDKKLAQQRISFAETHSWGHSVKKIYRIIEHFNNRIL